MILSPSYHSNGVSAITAMLSLLSMRRSCRLRPNINLKEMRKVVIGLEIEFFVDKQKKKH